MTSTSTNTIATTITRTTTARTTARTKVAASTSASSPVDSQNNETARRKKWTTASFALTLLGASIVVCVLFNLTQGHLHHNSIHHNPNDNTDPRKKADITSSVNNHLEQRTEQQQSLVGKPNKAEFLQHAQMFSASRRRSKKKDASASVASASGVSRPGLPPRLATLNCQAHGGPLDPAAAQEMVYWQDIPSDSRYQSPFYQFNQKNLNQKGTRTYYMTFEPDGGGWNNIRMAMETILGLAIATGRVLVLPPDQGMYLLRQGKQKQKTDFSFQDFFPMHEIASEQDGLHIITMQEFLEREALTGHLTNKFTGLVEFPPNNNRTDWNGQDLKPLKEWLRNVTLTPSWSPSSCMAAFPATADPEDAQKLQQMVDTIRQKGDWERRPFVEDPLPVDAPTYDRLKDNLNHRQSLCLYDSVMQQAPVLHFMCSHVLHVRFLTHFYSFLFLEDWREDLWMKRFMRDHVRYTDEIQCAAARIVEALRQIARNVTTSSPSGEFDTFHVRRGDFQFKATRIEATEIYANIKEILPGIDEATVPTTGTTPRYKPGVIFIATDERNKKFFDPLRQHYPHIYFLNDFDHLLVNVNTNFYGMIDQLVASRGRLFFGCWHSTFTGFINRMRGYHSQNEKRAGYETGALLDSFYYVPHNNLKIMQRYAPLQGAVFNREFPTSWRNLDYGIDAIQQQLLEQSQSQQETKPLAQEPQ